MPGTHQVVKEEGGWGEMPPQVWLLVGKALSDPWDRVLPLTSSSRRAQWWRGQPGIALLELLTLGGAGGSQDAFRRGLHR